MKSRLLLLMLLMLFNTSMVWSATYLPEQKPMSSVRLPSGYTLREELPSFIDLKRWIVFNESELTGIWLYDKTSKRVQGGITSLWALIFPGSFANSDYKYYCANIDETDVIQVFIEYECKGGKYRQSDVVCSNSFNNIVSKSHNSAWENLPPESFAGKLRERVCSEPRRLAKRKKTN